MLCNLRDAGDPVARRLYAEQGADEPVVLDVSATEERTAALDVVRQLRSVLRIPLTAGGGVCGILRDAQVLLAAGADKVAVNSAAVARQAAQRVLAARFGRQVRLQPVDARQIPPGAWAVRVRGGCAEPSRWYVDWLEEAAGRRREPF